MSEETFAIEWNGLVQRLEAFAEGYCRVKPSLGMVGEMLWVLGADFEFRLVPAPRDNDAVPPWISQERCEGCDCAYGTRHEDGCPVMAANFAEADASVDTHPQGGDSEAAPFMSGAVPSEETGDAQPSVKSQVSHD